MMIYEERGQWLLSFDAKEYKYKHLSKATKRGVEVKYVWKW